jgi:glucose PTS system EIICB or EIICBA component
VQLVDPSLASPDRLKTLGAAGVVRVSNNLQAIFGTRSENLKSDIEAYLRTAAGQADAAAIAPPVAGTFAREQLAAIAIGDDARRISREIAAALGGARNVIELEAQALTRLRVRLHDATLIDEAALLRAGVAAIMRLPGGALHLIVGVRAAELAAAALDLISVQLKPL